MDDLVELVRGDHARIGRLFEELEGVTGNQARLAVLWAGLAEVLLAHVGAFEEICRLPLRRAVPDSAPRTQDIDAQVLDICEAVAEARLLPAGSTQWWLSVRAAHAAIDLHISSVETGSLSRFAQLAPEATRLKLGRQWKRFMADLSSDRCEGRPG